MKHIFVTGATGQIGQFLIPALVEQGYHLRILVHRQLPPWESSNTIEWIHGNLLQPETYRSALKNVDEVIHMAAMTYSKNMTEYDDINHQGTQILIQECQSHTIERFIFLSTCAISEEGGAYSLSKNKAEACVMQSTLKWVIVRIAEVYGTTWDRGIDKIISAINRLPVVFVPGKGEILLAPIHISKVTQALVSLLSQSKLSNKIYHLCSSPPVTYRQWLTTRICSKKNYCIVCSIPLWIIKYGLKLMGKYWKNFPIKEDQYERLLAPKIFEPKTAEQDLNFDSTQT